MNKFICFALVLFAAFVSGNCGSYGNLGSYGNPSASSASAYAAPSYSLGPGNYGAHAPSYAAHAPSYGAHAPSYGAHAPSYGAHAKPSGPKYSVQPAYATELYPGQQNYKAYNSAPTYSQVALPVVPSVPVAKLYVPPQQAYGGHSYGGASNYGSSASY